MCFVVCVGLFVLFLWYGVCSLCCLYLVCVACVCVCLFIMNMWCVCCWICMVFVSCMCV